MNLTIHQHIVIGIIVLVVLAGLYYLGWLLSQFGGGSPLGAVFMILSAICVRVAPVAFVCYAVWAFFIDKKT